MIKKCFLNTLRLSISHREGLFSLTVRRVMLINVNENNYSFYSIKENIIFAIYEGDEAV